MKPQEGKEEMCTSLEEWALVILKPTIMQELKEAYNDDDKTNTHYNRTLQMRPTFSISNLNLTLTSGGGHNNSAIVLLNTNVDRLNTIPKTELAVNISKIITELATKADKKT